MGRESTFRVKSLTNSQDIQSMEVEGYSGGALQLSGQWTGTIILEGTIDDVNWFAMNMTPIPTTTDVSSATANGQWKFNCVGFKRVRAKFSAYTSGCANLTMRTITHYA